MAFLSSLGAAAGSAAGNMLGGLASTGLQYYLNKDLMGYANDLNKENLRNGPTIQRQGLEAAGYNPLLALSGYTSGLPSVSPMSVGQADLSNLGSSAMSAFKMSREAATEKERKDVVKSEVGVKQAEKADLEKSAELKDALKEKADADATKTKVETFTEPARVLSAVGGSVATAYGAKKIHDMFKNKGAVRVLELVNSKRLEQLRKVANAGARRPGVSSLLGSKALQSLGIFSFPVIPAASAYKLNKYLYDVSPSARKIIDNPNFGPRLR